MPSFCVAGVALGDVYLRSAWQAWHLWHWAGSGGALGPDWSPVTPRHFASQAWHLYALMALGWLRWRAWTGLVAGDAAALCVAGVALICTYGIGLRWRAWTGLVAGDAAALCVASVALGDTCLRFVGQAWHLWHWAGSGGALGLVLVAGDAAALCVAGVGTW